MLKNKLACVVKGLLTVTCICALSSMSAHAYTLKSVYKTEHFAVNQVILDPNETVDAPLQSSITGDVQTQNRLDKIYQSTTVIFPSGSKGFSGKINTPINGVLTIANYNTGKDRIYFNNKAKYLSEAGIYISFDQLIEMINQKNLNNLVAELSKLPVILTNVPVKATGFDPVTKSFYVTAVDDAVIIDARIDDSNYYSKQEMHKLNDSCHINMLTFVNRMIENIPVFINARAAINYISCQNNSAPTSK